MKLVILLWILPVTLGDIYVTCLYSAECLLPCTSTNLDIIHWYKDDKPVHSFYYNQDQLSHQSEDYKGRTSLLPGSEIKNGNVSLLLKNIRVQDEGRYKCYTANDKTNDEKFVSVSVEAPVKSVDITLKDDTVICNTSGVYPKPQVSWSSEPPANEPLKSFQQTEEKLFMVTSELKMGVISSTYKYTCSITSMGRTKTATLEKQAVSELPENEFIFRCPVPKDVHYTLILNFSTTVLTYDSKTSMKEISEQWRDKITFNPENGTVKLSHPNKEQLGTYTCESISADEDRYIMQASVSSRGSETLYICIGIIAAIIVIAIVIFAVIKRRKLLKKCSTDRTLSETSNKVEEVKMTEPFVFTQKCFTDRTPLETSNEEEEVKMKMTEPCVFTQKCSTDRTTSQTSNEEEEMKMKMTEPCVFTQKCSTDITPSQTSNEEDEMKNLNGSLENDDKKTGENSGQNGRLLALV